MPPLPLPATYIKIVPHQHSNAPPTILALDGPLTGDHSESSVYIPDLASKPWAPFCTQADFEYTETAVLGLLLKDLVNKQLVGIHNLWSTAGSNLMIHNYADMKKSLDAARQFAVPVCSCFLT